MIKLLVGFMAGIPFKVSSDCVRTFNDYKRSAGARWAKHDLLCRKPVLEFVGPELEKISFKMILSSDLGVNPRQELLALRKLRDDGEAFSLVIGGQPVSENLWTLESLDETVDFWGQGAKIKQATVSVSLQEYAIKREKEDKDEKDAAKKPPETKTEKQKPVSAEREKKAKEAVKAAMAKLRGGI